MYRPKRNPNEPLRRNNIPSQNDNTNSNNFYSAPVQNDYPKASPYMPMNQTPQDAMNGVNYTHESRFQQHQQPHQSDNSNQQPFYGQYTPSMASEQSLHMQSNSVSNSYTPNSGSDQIQMSQTSHFHNGFHPGSNQTQKPSMNSFSSGYETQFAPNSIPGIQSGSDPNFGNMSRAAQPVPPQPMTFMQDSGMRTQQPAMMQQQTFQQTQPMQPMPTSTPQMNSQTQVPPPQQSWQSPQPFMNAMAGAMLSGAQGGTGGMNAAIGAQLFQTLAPNAVGYTSHLMGSFMQMPKYYFTVNHRYVVRKLSIIMFPFFNRIWGRQRGMDAVGSTQNIVTYLPPREDVNAPDLYIPLMAFLTYVLMVGLTYGMNNQFKVDVMASFFSAGFGMLVIEVLIIKLGLTLINARPTPWLDVIAYRGYKFVGVTITILIGLLLPKLVLPALGYFATAMGLFLMRSHRRIILPRDMDPRQAEDLARRNLFLLFLSVLQYPIYFLLVPSILSRPGRHI